MQEHVAVAGVPPHDHEDGEQQRRPPTARTRWRRKADLRRRRAADVLAERPAQRHHASHGSTGYLMTTGPPLSVATVSADQRRRGPRRMPDQAGHQARRRTNHTTPNAEQRLPRQAAQPAPCTIIDTPMAKRTRRSRRPEPNETSVEIEQRDDRAARDDGACRSPSAGTPLATRRSTLSASDRPARKTKVGAQMWVIHRVKNPRAGSATSPASAYSAESCGEVARRRTPSTRDRRSSGPSPGRASSRSPRFGVDTPARVRDR